MRVLNFNFGLSNLTGCAFGLLIVGLLLSGKMIKAQPGDAIKLNGSDEYAEVDAVSDDVNSSDLTVTAWFQSTDTNAKETVFAFNPDDGSNRILIYDRSVFDNQKGTDVFYNSNNKSKFDDGNWHHVAVVLDNGSNTLTAYIDGVKKFSYNTTVSIQSSDVASIGQEFDGDTTSSGTSAHLKGEIDEVRVWSETRSISEIRDNMCLELSGSETNLEGYWKFNDGPGNTITDYAGSNNGTLKNNPNRVVSDVPLGDDRNRLYKSSGLTTSDQIANAPVAGDQFKINDFTGSPSGAQLVRVDNEPNNTNTQSPVQNISSSRYWVVVIIGGSSPSYDVTYQYNGHPNWFNGSEGDLTLASRPTNSSMQWSEPSGVTQDQNLDKLILANQTGTEYTLGSTSSSNPLPVELANFNVEKRNDIANISWETASETNNSHFLIQRKTGDAWQKVGRVEGHGTSTESHQYTYTDEKPQQGANYYRLKQVDFDGSYEYSKIKSVKFREGSSTSGTTVQVLENPVQENVRLNIQSLARQNMTYHMLNGQGRLVRKGQWELNEGQNGVRLNAQDLQAGTYFLKVKTNETVITKKLIK